jgi:hypothetical protein
VRSPRQRWRRGGVARQEHAEPSVRPGFREEIAAAGGSWGRRGGRTAAGRGATAAAASGMSQTARVRVSGRRLGPFSPCLWELVSLGVEARQRGDPPPGSEDAVVAAGRWVGVCGGRSFSAVVL